MEHCPGHGSDETAVRSDRRLQRASLDPRRDVYYRPPYCRGRLRSLAVAEALQGFKADETEAKLFPTSPLMLEGKACTRNDFLGPKGNVNTWVTGAVLHLTWLAYR